MTRDQFFWTAFGAAGLVLAGVYFVWGGSVRRSVEAERAQWDERKTHMQVMQTMARNRRIPNEASIQQWFEYQEWVEEQSETVKDFFRQRVGVMERRLAEGSRDPSPGDFRSYYNDLYRDSMNRVRRHMERGVQISGADTLFTRYPWMETDALPDPEDYRDIRRDIWVRRYFILSLLLQHNLDSLALFRVHDPEVIPIPNANESEFRAIPIRVRCTLPTEEVVKLLTAMLRVGESDADKLPVLMRELSISKGTGPGGRRSPPVTLEFLVDVVDFQPRDS